jgi:hypothetical protein
MYHKHIPTLTTYVGTHVLTYLPTFPRISRDHKILPPRGTCKNIYIKKLENYALKTNEVFNEKEIKTRSYALYTKIALQSIINRFS